MAGTLRKLMGQRIRQLRKSKGWTQQQLAEKSQMDYKYLGGIERGERNVTIDNLEKIASGFGMEAHQLFLFSGPDRTVSEEFITEVKIHALLNQSSTGRKQLMWRVLRELAVWEEER